MRSVCIMGGGLSGLMTGAILSKEGFRVIVLEKNAIIGGGLQSFRRGDYLFDTGMHCFGGMGENGQIRLICRYLGIEDKVEVVPRCDTLMDVGSGLRLTLPFGPRAWVERWSRAMGALLGREQVPMVRQQLERYLKTMYDLTCQEPLYHLRPTDNDYQIPDLSVSAKELIDSSIDLPMLRSIMPYLSLFYAGRENSPAMLHSLISCSHINGTYAFKHGSLSFANVLADLIKQAGGEVHTCEEVTSVEVDNRQVTCVKTVKDTYLADVFVSALPITRLLDLVSQTAFSPAFRRRITTAPLTYSALTVFVGLHPRTLCFNREAYYCTHLSSDPWNAAAVSEDRWPSLAFALPDEDPGNPGYAKTLTLVCPMDYSAVERWAGSRTGHRPEDYYRWKEKMIGQALKMIEPVGFEVPLQQAVAYVDAGSPLTIRDYYGNSRGAIYGLHPSCLNPLQTHLSPNTRISNLYITGQDVNFHGMVGTTLTSVLTAEALVGQNVIVNKINARK